MTFDELQAEKIYFVFPHLHALCISRITGKQERGLFTE